MWCWTRQPAAAASGRRSRRSSWTTFTTTRMPTWSCIKRRPSSMNRSTAKRDRTGNARPAALSTLSRGSVRRSPRCWRRSSSWSRTRPTTRRRQRGRARGPSATCAQSAASPAPTRACSAARATAARAVCIPIRTRAVSNGPPEARAGTVGVLVKGGAR